jgi:iron only hydrogenase large subunit-like protein/uncharacterized Fe-S cluster-containing protein
MSLQGNPRQIVFTNKARCRDCCRCVRVCPVKAIRVQDGQATVVGERCIACGTCIRECPQGAKSYRRDLEAVKEMVAASRPVAVSVAPSFAAFFRDWEYRRLPSVLRRLGFSWVAETAVGAYWSARRTAAWAAAHPQGMKVCTACPALVNYVELYRPELGDCLIPVPSPMAAHARLCKERLGPESRFVFVGPCVAKKVEAERPELAGLVDAAITFEELQEWLESSGIRMEAAEESGFDESPTGTARIYPLAGGLLRTADLPTDLLSGRHLAVSGFADIREALEQTETDGLLLEPLFCPQGCINGPAAPTARPLYHRRRELMAYHESHPGREPATEPAVEFPLPRFQARPVDMGANLDPAAIQRVLSDTGHATTEEQLNCGACGYPSCRDRAVAVILGLAERDMCLPFMRRLAEQRSDRIIETSPNGIVILDDRLNIIGMNPAFRRFFMCSPAVLGRRINYLMDPEPFEKLVSGQLDLTEQTVNHERYNLICHQIVYALREEKQFVGIFVNVTGHLSSQQKLDELRSRTVDQARELFEHQLAMAQQMARFLGESTARGEALVETLLKLVNDDPDQQNQGGGRLWDIFTSK